MPHGGDESLSPYFGILEGSRARSSDHLDTLGTLTLSVLSFHQTFFSDTGLERVGFFETSLSSF